MAASTQSKIGTRSRGDELSAGYAVKASSSANERWIARASVSLKTPKPSVNGSGEAYQSWNSDQAMARPVSSRPTAPPGLAAAEIGFGDERVEFGASTAAHRS